MSSGSSSISLTRIWDSSSGMGKLWLGGQMWPVKLFNSAWRTWRNKWAIFQVHIAVRVLTVISITSNIPWSISCCFCFFSVYTRFLHVWLYIFSPSRWVTNSLHPSATDTAPLSNLEPFVAYMSKKLGHACSCSLWVNSPQMKSLAFFTFVYCIAKHKPSMSLRKKKLKG